jgi:hypothetical protein
MRPSITTPTRLATSRMRMGSGRRRNASSRKKRRCPPSSTGMGSRLMSPTFTEMTAMVHTKSAAPRAPALPAMSYIVMGPLTLESATRPSRSRSSPTLMNLTTLRVSSTPRRIA